MPKNAGTGAKGANTKKECFYCETKNEETPRKKKDVEGCAIGNPDDLSRSILNHCNGIKKWKHKFYSGGDSIQPHHIISSESMKEDSFWLRFVHICGYSINHWRNGIFLPSVLKVACNLEVPLHDSHHGAGKVGSTKYPTHVKKLVRKIKEEIIDGKHEYCEHPEKIRKKLDRKSELLLDKIAQFTITITGDGKDYAKGNPVGCGNVNSISAKKKGEKAGQKCTCRKKGQNHKIEGQPTKLEVAADVTGDKKIGRSFTYYPKHKPLKIGT